MFITTLERILLNRLPEIQSYTSVFPMTTQHVWGKEVLLSFVEQEGGRSMVKVVRRCLESHQVQLDISKYLSWPSSEEAADQIVMELGKLIYEYTNSLFQKARELNENQNYWLYCLAPWQFLEGEFVRIVCGTVITMVLYGVVERVAETESLPLYGHTQGEIEQAGDRGALGRRGIINVHQGDKLSLLKALYEMFSDFIQCDVFKPGGEVYMRADIDTTCEDMKKAVELYMGGTYD